MKNDSDPPTNFTSKLGEINSNSVEFIVNADDNSGQVIYSITLGDTEKQYRKKLI